MHYCQIYLNDIFFHRFFSYCLQVVNHEQFRDVVYINDISLLKTTIGMNLGHTSKVVTLPRLGAKRLPVKTPLQVSGWGMMENGIYPTMLRAVEVDVRYFKECQSYGGKNINYGSLKC